MPQRGLVPMATRVLSEPYIFCETGPASQPHARAPNGIFASSDKRGVLSLESELLHGSTIKKNTVIPRNGECVQVGCMCMTPSAYFRAVR